MNQIELSISITYNKLEYNKGIKIKYVNDSPFCLED